MAASHTDDFNLDFAVQVALLHDLLEDTSATYQEIKEKFGEDIAVAVLALSKNDKLPAEQQTIDSLTRIRQLSNEVWAVKLADRITNLQTPPGNWSKKKISGYREESGLILHALKKGNRYLAERLKEEIRSYAKYT